MVAYLFPDDTVLYADSEEGLQKVMNEIYCVCTGRNLKVNAGKSKVMVFERRKVDVVDFNLPYRVSVPAVRRCEIVLKGKKMKEVKKFKYMGSVMRTWRWKGK